MRNTRRKSRGHKGRRGIHIGGTTANPCVIVDLASQAGLGNQLFIYSAGIVAKNKTGLPMCILPAKGNFHSSKNYRTIFKHGTPVEQKNMNSRLNRALKVHENIASDPHGKWSNRNLPTNKTRNVAMKGVFYQNYEAIKTAIPAIRAELTDEFKKQYPGFEVTSFKDTSPAATIFMHVRKGDYGPKALPTDYYARAIDIVNGVEKIKTMYILSDDVPYCKDQIANGAWKPNAEVRWMDDPNDELKTMYLMSMCKGGAIMSASTFSCWGAFLGPDEVAESTIIYPKMWGTGDSSRITFPETVGNRWISI